MADLNNAHDLFFRESMGRKDIARDFMSCYLPVEVKELLKLDSLQVKKETFIDTELKEHFSDLLFQVNLNDGGGAHVYILFEHKSHPEPDIALQLLRYMVRIWETDKKQKQPFSPIFPVVMYYGKQLWNIGKSLQDLIATPSGLQRYLPDFEYWLCDLSEFSDEELQGQANLRMLLFVLKYAIRNELHEHLATITELMRELSRSQTGLQYIEVVLRYLTTGTESLNDKELQYVVEESIDGGESLMSTIAERWVEQGHEQGLLEGIELALEVKFGQAGLNILPALRKIDDVASLRSVRDAIRTSKSPAELERLLPNGNH